MQSNLPYRHDPDFIHHFAGGEPTAFTSIYKQFYYKVYQYAKRWLTESKDAEDVTADTFVKLWDRKANFENIENITGFLFVTVRNACFDLLKHRHVKSDKQSELLRQYQVSQETDFNLQEIREEFLKMVYAEVEKMPAKMRDIFLLSYSEGLKPAEIAKKLNLSVQTVSNQKTNAIQLIKLALGDKPLLLAFLLYLEMQSHWFA